MYPHESQGAPPLTSNRRSPPIPASVRGFPVKHVIGTALAVLASASLAACATTASKPASKPQASSPSAPLPKGLDPATTKDPFPSTYRALPGRNVAIIGATVLTGTGTQIENG